MIRKINFALMALMLLPMFSFAKPTIVKPSIKSATSFAIIALPASMLVPLIFVRLGVGFTEILYRLMILLAAVNCVVMAL